MYLFQKALNENCPCNFHKNFRLPLSGFSKLLPAPRYLLEFIYLLFYLFICFFILKDEIIIKCTGCSQLLAVFAFTLIVEQDSLAVFLHNT